jgi:hypothetical protein
MKKLIILLLALLVLRPNVSAQDSYGQDFWLAVPQNYVGGGTIELYVTAQSAASVTVDIPSIPFSTTVPVAANTLTTISLPSSVQISVSGTSNKSVHVTSTTDVTVYLMNQQNQTTDAHLALPVDAIGSDYYLMTYTPGFAPTTITVVATQNNTTVNINPKVNNSAGLTAGVSTAVVLNQGQVYTVRSSASSGTTGDLTGSYINADKPIAVFGASECAQVPNGVPYCDYLVEQMTPTSSWGKNFVTVPLGARTSGDVFRILSNTAGNAINIDGALVATLGVGQFFETTLASGTYHRINTTNPVLVGQFAKGSTSDGTVSDPFFALVPPDDQFIVNYIISSGTPNIFNNYVNIISPNSNLSNVQLDGVTVGAGLWNAIAGTSFSGAVVGPFTNGVHTVTSVLPIGVMAYGWGSDDSYGYLGGQSFSPVATVSQFSLNLSQTTAIQAQQKCVIATVLDQNNNPVVGVLVNFTVSGANAGAAGFGTTNAQGEVTLCYNVCQSGQDILTATIAGLTDDITINVAPSSLTVNPGVVNASAGVQSCVTATVLDGSNVPVPGAIVNFTVAGTNAAALVSIATNAQGEAQFCYTPASSGNDVINVSAGCTGGNTATVNVAVGGGGPCPPGPTITLTSGGLNALWVNAGANAPNTFYYGVTNALRINATIVGGVGPYTYAWTSTGGPGTLMPRATYPLTSIDLFEPTGPVTVTLTITDANNCSYSGSINMAWSDVFYCNHLTQKPYTWYLYMCQGGNTVCVSWASARTMLRNNTGTLGPCTPKTDLVTTGTSFSVYPNPSSGLFTLEMPIVANTSGTVTVMDVNGRALYAETLNMQEGILYHSFDLGALPNGIYVVRVATENEFATERIQIIR